MRSGIRRISLLLALVLVVTFVPFGVFAEGTGNTGNNGAKQVEGEDITDTTGEGEDSGTDTEAETPDPEDPDEDEDPEEDPVLKVTVKPDKESYKAGDKVTLTAEVTAPEGYTLKKGESLKYTWEGQEGTVSEDKTSLTFTAEEAKDYKVTVSVSGNYTKNEETTGDPGDSIEIKGKGEKEFTVNPKEEKPELTLAIKGKDKIIKGVKEEYTIKDKDKFDGWTITWGVNDVSVLKVHDKNPLTLEGLKEGKATLTATASKKGEEDLKATKEIKVIEKTYKVTLVADDKTEVIEVAHGEKISDDHNPKKDGYEFAGWYTDKEFKEKYKNEGVTEPITLYAKFEKKDELGTIIHMAYIEGYPDGTFRPQGQMTRAEAATMFARLLNKDDDFKTSKTTKFIDANDDWFSEAVNYAVSKGLIKGYEDGTFKPNRPITRAEFAQMISGYLKGDFKGTTKFTDINDHWAKEAIEKAYGKKVVQGYPDGTFKPDENITRAEAVAILNATFGRLTTEKSFTGGVKVTYAQSFKDVSTSDWFFYHVIDAATQHIVQKADQDSVDIWKTIIAE